MVAANLLQKKLQMTKKKIEPRRTARPKTAREIAERVGCSERTVRQWWAMPREEYEANSYSRTKPWEHFGISRTTWYRRGKPMPSETQQGN